VVARSCRPLPSTCCRRPMSLDSPSPLLHTSTAPCLCLARAFLSSLLACLNRPKPATNCAAASALFLRAPRSGQQGTRCFRTHLDGLSLGSLGATRQAWIDDCIPGGESQGCAGLIHCQAGRVTQSPLSCAIYAHRGTSVQGTLHVCWLHLGWAVSVSVPTHPCEVVWRHGGHVTTLDLVGARLMTRRLMLATTAATRAAMATCPRQTPCCMERPEALVERVQTGTAAGGAPAWKAGTTRRRLAGMRPRYKFHAAVLGCIPHGKLPLQVNGF